MLQILNSLIHANIFAFKSIQLNHKSKITALFHMKLRLKKEGSVSISGIPFPFRPWHKKYMITERFRGHWALTRGRHSTFRKYCGIGTCLRKVSSVSVAVLFLKVPRYRYSVRYFLMIQHNYHGIVEERLFQTNCNF